MMKHTDDINAFNTALAKCLQSLKKRTNATKITQNYKGTGSKSHRRQIYVRFADGWITDLWLSEQMLAIGGCVGITGIGIDYGGRSPEKVVEVLVEMLNRRSRGCAPTPLP